VQDDGGTVSTGGATATAADGAADGAGIVERGAAPLAPGVLINGRYRIVRPLGEGGMGAVYEVEDVVLRERVALKALHPHVARSVAAVQRFRREVHLARRVTHRSVCRILEFGVHQTEREELSFLTMELVRGETLSERLRRCGRLATDVARPIAEQVAAALDAAHAAGVVHRDLKSSNILVAAEAGGAERVVVTDFGIACSVSHDEDSVDLGITGADELVGTPVYIAPEQVTHGAVTAATDIYSFGVVLYEMVTGTFPFLGKTRMQTATLRLRARPAPPSTHVRDLDPRWDRAIVRCLQRDPAARFRTAGGLIAALGRRRQRAPLAALATLAVVGAASLAMALRRPSPVEPTARAPVVAVVGFEDRSVAPGAAWISTAVADTLGEELAAGGGLRCVPAELVARMKADLGLANRDAYESDALEQIRRYVGAEYVVAGVYASDVGAGLRVDLRLQRTDDGATVAKLHEQGSEAAIATLAARAAVALRPSLGAPPPLADAGERRDRLPGTSAAASAYIEGLERLRLKDAAGARRLLERAVAADPGFALAYAALARACWSLTFSEAAEAAAQRAHELATELADDDRLEVEATYQELVRGDWKAAAELSCRRFAAHPGDLDRGLACAQARRRSGDLDEASVVLAALHALPSPLSDDLRLDDADAALAVTRGDAAAGFAALDRALEKGKARGAQSFVAEAHDTRARYLFRVGGEPAEIVGHYQDALRIFRHLGNQATAARVLNDVGDVYLATGELAAAQRAFEESSAIAAQVGSDTMRSWGELSAAAALAARGEPAAARRLAEQTLLLAGNDTSLNHQILGEIALLTGDLPAVKRHLEEAARANKRTFSLSHDRRVRAGLARLSGDDATSRRILTEQAASADAWFGAEARIALARLDAEQGRLLEAEPEIRDVLADVRRRGERDEETLAWVTLAGIAAVRGAAAEANAALAAATALAQTRENLPVRLEATVEAARVRALLPIDARELRATLRTLDEAGAAAEHAGLAPLRLEAKLVRAELDLEHGDPRTARAALTRVATEASALGLGRTFLRARALIDGAKR
jgi:tRNA A-37 threonylcarbamoyl transferase component Bud32